MRTIFVTGGNRGLGLALCKALVKRGDRVILAARSDPKLKGAEYRRLDVTSREDLAALANEKLKLDVLVNNAAIAESTRQTFDVNYFGAAQVMDALAGSDTHVVMLSSGMGELSGMPKPLRAQLTDPALNRAQLDAIVRGLPTSNAYSASKACLNALVRLEARAGRWIDAVCPGWVRTDMGGSGAPRSIEEGTASILYAVNLPRGTTGGFWRDGAPATW